jgi:hypothetical protein
MADVFDTGQRVAKPFSALSQKGVENKLERLNADTFINSADSTFSLQNASNDLTFKTQVTVSQACLFQFKARIGGFDGLDFQELNTAEISNGQNEDVTIPLAYRGKPFQLIVSTRLAGSNKPAFVQQATIPAWPALDETLTFNTCDND